jgi:GNAT superfamily N-acetyltransferase
MLLSLHRELQDEKPMGWKSNARLPVFIPHCSARQKREVFLDKHKNIIDGSQNPAEAVYTLEKNGSTGLRVLIRRCVRDELEEILGLQQCVYDTVQDKDTFVLSTEKELAESLETDVCLGAYVNDRLIAFTLVVINPASARNLGYCLNYPQEISRGCATYDTTFVHPSYTGYGLQRLFLSLKDAAARENGAGVALATVSPDNRVSLNNLKAGGFEIAEEKRMYGDRLRYVMRKSLI